MFMNIFIFKFKLILQLLFVIIFFVPLQAKNIDKFNEGKTEKEIILLLSDRYGEYILFEPLLNKRNIFLWLFPFTLLFISIVFFIYYVKKRNSD